MKTYLFETTTTMKEYNCEKWWIDGNIVKRMRIDAENMTGALKEYQKRVDDDFITISDNAIKNKQPMYIDGSDGPIQTGYVITGSMYFDNGNGYCDSKQYIDLWVNISVVSPADF